MGNNTINRLDKLIPGRGGVTVSDFVRTQDRVKSSIDNVAARPQLSSSLLKTEGSSVVEGLSLTTGYENWVTHGLGREVQGWRLIDITGPAIVWRVDSSTADTSIYLPLGCTASVTIKIEVW